MAPCDRVAQCLPVYGQLGSSVGQEVQPVFDDEPGFDHLGSRPGPDDPPPLNEGADIPPRTP